MKLAVGTAQIGLDYGLSNRQGKVALPEAGAIVSYARSAGITMLDTASSYGDGEARLGEIGIDGFDVVSKLPAMPDGCGDAAEWMADIVRRSLADLRIERLHGLLLHRPGQLIEPRGKEIHAGLQALKDAGLVLKTGASIYAPSELDTLYPSYPFDIVQAPFNLFDNRIVESGWLNRLKANGAEVHVRSIFLQGLLLLSAEERPEKFRRWASHLARYDAWLATHDRTPLEACVSYVMSVPEIDRIVVGVDSAAQLRAIVAATSISPPVFADELPSADPELLDPVVWLSL